MTYFREETPDQRKARLRADYRISEVRQPKDDRLTLDTSDRPFHRGTRSDSVRRQAGLSPLAKSPDEVIEAASEAAERAAGSPERADELLRQGAEDAEERLAIKRLANSGISLYDPRLEPLMHKEWGNVEDYWRAINRKLDRYEVTPDVGEPYIDIDGDEPMDEPQPKATDAAKELREIQAGKHGSITSPHNKARRAELMAELKGK